MDITDIFDSLPYILLDVFFDVNLHVKVMRVNFCYNHLLNTAVESLAPNLHTPNITVSNLGWDIGYNDGGVLLFSSVSPDKWKGNANIKPQQIYSAPSSLIIYLTFYITTMTVLIYWTKTQISYGKT
jgi:hypothetical protein